VEVGALSREACGGDGSGALEKVAVAAVTSLLLSAFVLVGLSTLVVSTASERHYSGSRVMTEPRTISYWS
jgi:hypothetical protein